MGFVRQVKGQPSPSALPLRTSLHHGVINRTRARVLKDDYCVAIVKALQPWKILMRIVFTGTILVRILYVQIPRYS